MNQDKYNELLNCIEYNEDRKIYLYKDDTPEDIKAIVSTAIHATEEPLDLAYNIAHASLYALSDVLLSELSAYNPDNDNYDGFASIYTSDRLAYLNNGNQQEISDLMKECSADDIATACAYWFDRKVTDFIENIKGQIVTE